MYKAGTITYYCSLISSYLILMLYYCVCFEASSLVISGQPFCLFLSTIPHHCTSTLYCLPFKCAALFSYKMDFQYGMTFISTLKNSHEKDHNIWYFCQQITLSPRVTFSFSAISKACVRNPELSLGACLPGQCHYYLDFFFWSVLLSV